MKSIMPPEQTDVEFDFQAMLSCESEITLESENIAKRRNQQQINLKSNQLISLMSSNNQQYADQSPLESSKVNADSLMSIMKTSQ